MRTLRLSLAGTVILALLGGLGGAALAQDEIDAQVSTDSAVVAFKMPWIRAANPPTVELGEGWQLNRDHVFTSTIDAGDPRLHGELWMVQNYLGFYSGGNVGVGFAGIDGEDGAWRGTFRSANTHLDWKRSLYQIEMAGEGAYEGLSVILFLIDDLRTSHDVEGFIFPCEMPPMPEMQEPLAE